jgi:hypothetical protein
MRSADSAFQTANTPSGELLLSAASANVRGQADNWLPKLGDFFAVNVGHE